MRIDNTGRPGPQVPPANTAPPAEPGKPPAPTPAVPDASSHLPSAELAQLVELVRQEPEVREDVVQQAGQRLGRGYYGTPQAAQDTAGALLEGND